MALTKRTNTKYPDIFCSCTINESWIGEQHIQETRLIHVVSGKLHLYSSDRHYIITRNKSVLLKRNQLLKLKKEPENNEIPFSSIVFNLNKICLRELFLKEFSEKEYKNKVEDHIKTIDNHPLITGLFESLQPYFQSNITPTKELVKLKIREIVLVLLQIDKQMANYLFDSSEPGKIDLEEFMDQNFMFNVPLERFAYLSGRSLSTFKRDFHKCFNISPHKWLTKKRLQAAHYMISENHKKPSDVYLEVGFENLSHFSRVFKSEFGYNPSYL